MNYKVGDKIKCKKNYKHYTISSNTDFKKKSYLYNNTIPFLLILISKKNHIYTITDYKQRSDGVMYFVIESDNIKPFALYLNCYNNKFDNFNIIDYFYSKNELRKLKLLSL